MYKKTVFIALLVACLMQVSVSAVAKENSSTMKEDGKQIKSWNQFAEAVHLLHQSMLAGRSIRTEETSGGYNSGYLGSSDFYREVSYYDKQTGRLLSIIQWEKDNPEQIHTVEVFVYDEEGRVTRDYLAAWLPVYRNAPIQTLVNFHGYDDDLHAFRQFDASGERIYEQCSGKHFGEDVDISLEDYELLAPDDYTAKILASEVYIACFGEISTIAGDYLDPMYAVSTKSNASIAIDDANSVEAVRVKIKALALHIEAQPNNAKYLVARGELYIYLHEFDEAVADFSRALVLDDNNAEAYFWRGMALGRQAQFDAAIADLTRFLQLRPESSRGYTKRGVRYIWKGDLKRAEHDLRTAIKLDSKNAEAHDDLGVILAQRGELLEAARHFSITVSLDPTYQKGHQNLAMAYFMQRRLQPALESVNRCLGLSPQDRSALLLKSEILSSLGRQAEAANIKEQAEFLPEGNWSEQFNVN